MIDHLTFAYAASALSVVCTLYYACTIVWGPSEPPRSSYWIWCVIGVMLLGSYTQSNATNWYLNFANCVGTGLIAVLTIWYGEGTALTKWDWRAIKFAAASIPIWIALRLFFVSEHAAAIAFAVQMVADAFASIPMLEKCWNRPEKESRSSWVLGTAVFAINGFAVEKWTFQDVIWNGWLGGICFIVTIMLFTRPRSKPAVVSETS